MKKEYFGWMAQFGMAVLLRKSEPKRVAEKTILFYDKPVPEIME